MSVLNRRLYDAIKQRYGNVVVVNPGEPGHVTRTPSYGHGKARLDVRVDGGEAYKVRCKVCRDWRPRLHFNHLWGTRDPQSRQQLLHLVHCFNEDCFSEWITCRNHFESLMTSLRRRRGRLPEVSSAISQSVLRESPAEIALPRGSVALNDLAPNHHARKYLETRDFDIAELWKLWRVRYCRSDANAKPKIFNRIVVPIFRPKDRFADNADKRPDWCLAGWQARLVKNVPDSRTPKYLSAAGMTKSSLLYGLPHAMKGKNPVAITEGVTDVWRLGRNAVATFGKNVSARQESQIVHLFEGRPLVVAFDDDAVEECRKVCARLSKARAAIHDNTPVEIVRLGKKRKDIGDCTRDEARAMILRAVGR